MAQKAIEVAKTATGETKMGAVLAKGRRVLSATTNLPSKSHPLQAEYAKKSGNPRRIYLHAELRSLIQARKAGDTMYVARVNKKGYMRMARPCKTCQLALEDRGIKEVFYTTSNGWEKIEINS